MKKLSEKARLYARKYGQPPYGREIEGTADLLLQMADELEKYEDLEEKGRGKYWNAIIEKGLPPIGQPLIVTIKDNLQGMQNQLRYPVYYVKDTMKNQYCWKWIFGDMVYDLLSEVSDVIAWRLIPEVFDEE